MSTLSNRRLSGNPCSSGDAVVGSSQTKGQQAKLIDYSKMRVGWLAIFQLQVEGYQLRVLLHDDMLMYTTIGKLWHLDCVVVNLSEVY